MRAGSEGRPPGSGPAPEGAGGSASPPSSTTPAEAASLSSTALWCDCLGDHTNVRGAPSQGRVVRGWCRDYHVLPSALFPGAAASPRARDARGAVRMTDQPFRIALVGDFGARAGRDAPESGRALSARRPLRVDRDSVDAAIARIAPMLEIDIAGAGHTVHFAPRSVEDFHPDRLAALPFFESLR